MVPCVNFFCPRIQRASAEVLALPGHMALRKNKVHVKKEGAGEEMHWASRGVRSWNKPVLKLVVPGTFQFPSILQLASEKGPNPATQCPRLESWALSTSRVVRLYVLLPQFLFTLIIFLLLLLY